MEQPVSKYYLVSGEILPDVFLKVVAAKEMLETGECSTVADAVRQTGISRSAFYKYRDHITPFRDMKSGRIITFQFLLRDRKGVLSGVLSLFASVSANILTINQNIPSGGTAIVTITAVTEEMVISPEELLEQCGQMEGVLKIELLAG